MSDLAKDAFCVREKNASASVRAPPVCILDSALQRSALPRRLPSSEPPFNNGANRRLLDKLNRPDLAREIRAKLTESGPLCRHSKSRDFRLPCILGRRRNPSIELMLRLYLADRRGRVSPDEGRHRHSGYHLVCTEGKKNATPAPAARFRKPKTS